MSEYSSVAANQSNLSQSQAFAAALQRAKQIAAKIQPNQAPGNPGGGGGGGVGSGGLKRSLDDSDSGPDNKRFTSPNANFSHNSNSNMSSGGGSNGNTGGGPPAGNISQALAQAAQVAARIAASGGTTCEEQVRMPETIVNAMTGRGSNETIQHIQGESGCKVQLSQESETVCTLRGSRECVTKGREMMQQLANRNGGGNVEVILTINMPPPGPTGFPPYQEIMIPGAKVGLVIGKGGDTIKQLQEKTGAKMVIIQDGPNQEVVKPLRISGDPQKIEHAKQLVLDLIATKETPTPTPGRNPNMNSGGGNNSMGGNSFNNFGGEQCEVFVPKIAVGVVIGKGGDMIRKIQAETGCKLQFIQGKNDEPGDRRCLIQGTRQQVDDAKRTIDGLIENVMTRNRNGAPGGNNANNDNGNSNYGYGYGVNHAQQPAREEITFMVPAAKCGIVIGRGGETIKLINQQTGAYCEMDRNAVNPPSEKLFKCKGTSEQVEAARQMIAEKINMELTVISRKPISGGMPNNQHGQQGGGYNQNQMQNDPNAAYQQQWAGYGQNAWGDPSQQQQMAAMGQSMPGAAAAGGQSADYSLQWIEYYKSMGMHREAEMIENQLKAKQATAGQQMNPSSQQQQQQSAPGTASAAGQQQDYSAQWAEYYRSIGKIEEAEAIEKQMKSAPGNPSNSSAVVSSNASGTNAGANNSNAAAAGQQQQPQMGGYPQGMTPAQYAQYSQYYAAAAAAAGGAPPGAYPQGYGGYAASGGYPGAPQPPGPNGTGQQPPQNPQKSNKSDKN